MSAGTRSHAAFDSKIGALAVAWSERGLVGVQLPEGTRAKTLQRIAARAGSRAGKPPPWVERAAEGLRALVAGSPADLDGVPLDAANVPEFHGRVYAALRKLRAGETCTYAELARAAGSPSAARAVGQAMRRNPWPLVVPCHRVLAAGDRLGGFSAKGGVALKARLLRAESTKPWNAAAGTKPAAQRARPDAQRDGTDAQRAKLEAQRDGTEAQRVRPAAQRGKPEAQRGNEARRAGSGASRVKTVAPRAKLDAQLARNGLAFDPQAALRHLREQDPRLGELIERVPFTLEPPAYASTFEALLRTIVYQQLNGKAAATIHARVVDLLPGKRIDARALLALSPQALRGAGLSRAKVLAARDLAQRTASGELPGLAELARMSDEEIVERLTVVRGIGRWSVEMLLMFWLGRPDVLPLGDFGVRHGFQLFKGMRSMPSERSIERHARCWRPYRSVAAWYMWRAVDEARARTVPR